MPTGGRTLAPARPDRRAFRAPPGAGSKFTHRADINLDGLVTPDDSAVFGGNYDESADATWATGDLNYDATFTPDDASIPPSLPDGVFCRGVSEVMTVNVSVGVVAPADGCGAGSAQVPPSFSPTQCLTRFSGSGAEPGVPLERKSPPASIISRMLT